MVFYGASYGSVLEGYTFLQMFVGVVLCQLVSTHILNDPAKTCLLVQVPYEWMHQLKESCDSVCLHLLGEKHRVLAGVLMHLF